MLGAIMGDIIGSAWELDGHKSVEFPLITRDSHFTDDTVLTVATASALLRGTPYADAYYEYGNRYPRAGYGGSFRAWLASEERAPYGSWGNGSAMRVSPVGWARSTVEEVLEEAERSAEVTHDHPEGIRGAQAVALAVFLARTGSTKAEIRDAIRHRIGYPLDRTVDEIRPGYHFDVSCQGSVPEAITAFLESDDFKHAIRLAVSLGGDADTQAAIAGGIAEAFYGDIPWEFAQEALERVPGEFRETVLEFRSRFMPVSRPGAG